VKPAGRRIEVNTENSSAPEGAPVSDDRPAAPPPVERPARPEPWAQLRFFTFQPHIFPRMLEEVSRGARPGDLVAVYDKAGRLCGAGLLNPRAKIPLRVVRHSTELVDESYFEAALRAAAALRRDALRLDACTDAYRLVNSDGDGLSGLIADRYGPVLVVEAFSLGVVRRLPRWLPLLHECAGTKHHLVRIDPEIARVEGIGAADMAALPPPPGGGAPRRIKVREHGAVFEVDLETGHKTGFFCDQRDNRKRFAEWIPEGARVLDLCCYSGGFALAAAATGKAAEITGVDLDEEAIAMAKRNANLARARIRWVHADAFAYARQMRKNGEMFDAVVLDPPKLVLTREPEGAAEGHRKYEDLNQLAIAVVKPGGLFASCSCSGLVSHEQFEEHVIKAAHRLGRRLQLLGTTGAGPDHPVYSNCLESRYLKVVWARVV
jgi:23S rRNA (cytosine1962-C5)-methyltransferase